MMKFSNTFYLLALTLLSCKKPYNPPALSTANSYLVVEGAINSGTDSTVIKLSKTVKLDSTTTVNPLLGATVTVESSQNGSWRLFDFKNNGRYASASLNLPAMLKYRLRINTSEGGQYLSDFIAVKPTPPIDSIGYILQDGAVQLYVNTHDPANNTHYYRWEYDETWFFHSRWQSEYVYDPLLDSLVQRLPSQQVYFCYANDKSTNILLGSTAKLAKDVVYQSPLTNIPLTSEKVESKYSILVRQYALPAEAYQFYQNIEKNTEQLGSIFDAQPSQLKGNIHSLANPAEPVIGYLTVTNVQSKRIFIPTSDLTTQILTIYPYDCVQDTAAYHNSLGVNTVRLMLLSQPITNIPTAGLGSTLPVPAFLYSSSICVDCTLRGTTQAPPFWK
ncbi:MAG TPA: DUF4249 domain-containing protein [Mucilaginibacter sp.]|jgi:hypothetical protein